jgi:hypothetical protein
MTIGRLLNQVRQYDREYPNYPVFPRLPWRGDIGAQLGDDLEAIDCTPQRAEDSKCKMTPLRTPGC